MWKCSWNRPQSTLNSFFHIPDSFQITTRRDGNRTLILGPQKVGIWGLKGRVRNAMKLIPEETFRVLVVFIKLSYLNDALLVSRGRLM